MDKCTEKTTGSNPVGCALKLNNRLFMKEKDPLSNLLYKEGQHLTLSDAEEAILDSKELIKKYLDYYESERPNPEDFLDAFPDKHLAETIIREDLRDVKKREDEFPEKASEQGRLAERLLYYLINKKGLLGSGVEAIATSRFDDIFRGIDFVLEFPAADSTTSKQKKRWLSLDITVSEDKEKLEAKSKALEKELQRGNLPQVRYFQSEPDTKGPTRMPKIILPLNRDEIEQMARLLTEKVPDDVIFRLLQENITNRLKGEILGQLQWLEKDYDRNDEALFPVPPRNAHALAGEYRATLQSISPSS